MNVRQKLSLAAMCIALPALASAQAAAPAAPAAEPAKPAAPAMETKVYGFALVTYNMMDGGFAYPEYPGKIANEKVGTADNKTTILSVRQSRFGFSIANADSGLLGAKLGGRIEADFFGGAAVTVSSTCVNSVPGETCTVTNTTTSTSSLWDSALLRLRYAFGVATWDAGPGKLSLTVGQTDGLVTPLHPELGAYIATPTFMLAGNLVRRSPQIRVGYDAAVNDMVGVTLEAAALSPQDKGGASVLNNAGNNSNTPDLEFRGQAVVKPVAEVKATIGVGFHTNKQTYGLGTTTEQSLTSTLFGVDVNVEATKYLNVRGEFFSGKGSDEGQLGSFADLKVTTAGARELLKTSGFWAQAVVKPLPYLWVMGGFGQTKADVSGDPTYSMMNVGVLAPVGKNLRFGLEYTTSKYDVDAIGATPAVSLSGSAVALSSRFSF